MKKALLILFGLWLFFTGCIPSIYPLYKGEDLVFDPVFVGVWTGKDGSETWTFTQNGEKAYKLVYVDAKGRDGTFDVHLLKIGNNRFFDLYPVAPDLRQNDFYKGYLLRVHSFVRVQHQDDVVQMSFIHPDWLKKHLQEEPAAIRHEKLDHGILLTAQPKELQEFLIKHDKTASAWGACNPLIRKDNESDH